MLASTGHALLLFMGCCELCHNRNMERMPSLPEQQRNIREALEGAREDLLAADTEEERHIHMLAIDQLLDVGLNIGAFAIEGAGAHSVIDPADL